MSMRFNELPEYETIKCGRDLTDCLRFPQPEDYADLADVKEWNGFVPSELERPFIRSDMMRKNADGHWENTSEKWKACNLLIFEFEYCFYMGLETGSADKIKVNRKIRVAARDWDEAGRIFQWKRDEWMSCGLISGWQNIWSNYAVNAIKEN